MATHKDLSNFSNEYLAQYKQFELQTNQLKASLTPKQSNMVLPQSTIDDLEELYSQYPEAQKPKDWIVSLVLESLIVAILDKISPIFIDAVLELIKSIV